MKESSQYLAKVREQYENYPYPQRLAEDEKQRLLVTDLNILEKINYYCFGGKQDFQNIRVLIAGCGTGDGLIYTAEQLRETNSEVIAIDISESSIQIAKERARIRGLKNIRWVHDSLLELPNLELGSFDFIGCSGVLHHLADPDAGLKALKSVLKDNGAMGIMLYGKYGRTGIYQMQHLMRLINNGEENLQTQVENTKNLLDSLPTSNWYKRGEELITDVTNFGDIGIYDLFLHSQDRAYDILEVYDFAEKAGLSFVDFPNWHDRFLYTVDNFVKEPDLLEKIKKLDLKTQRAISEIIVGSIKKQTFYIAANPLAKPSLENGDNVPFLFGFDADAHKSISQIIEKHPGQAIDIDAGVAKFSFTPTKYSKYIFRYLDGSNDIATIMNNIKIDLKDSNISEEEILADIKSVYEGFNRFDRMFIRHKSVPQFTSQAELQKRAFS